MFTNVAVIVLLLFISAHPRVIYAAPLKGQEVADYLREFFRGAPSETSPYQEYESSLRIDGLPSQPNFKHHVKFLEIALSEGRIYVNPDATTLPAGLYNYVILADGTMVFGFLSDDVEIGVKHFQMANGRAVIAAGEYATGSRKISVRSGSYSKKLLKNLNYSEEETKQKVRRAFGVLWDLHVEIYETDILVKPRTYPVKNLIRYCAYEIFRQIYPNICRRDERKQTVETPPDQNAWQDLIEKRIKTVLDQQGVPVVFFEINDVIFSRQKRMLEIFRSYDRLHGSQIFSGIEDAQLNLREYKEWLNGWIERKTSAGKHVEQISRNIIAFVAREKVNVEWLARDHVYQEALALIKRWQDIGARLVVVTSRENYTRHATAIALEAAALRPDIIYYDYPEVFENTTALKISGLRHEMAGRGKVPVVFFDAKQSVLNAVGAFSSAYLLQSIPSIETAEIKPLFCSGAFQ